MAVGVDEVLVLETEHSAAPHDQVAAAGQALRIETGGPVEGLGHRRTPVHDQGLVVWTRDGQPADVERLAEKGSAVAVVAVARLREAIDAPEVERLVADVQLLQPGQAGAYDDVALGARLERATPTEVEHTLEHVAGLAAHELQPVVGTVEVLLLILQIRMYGHLSPSSPEPAGKRFSLDALPHPPRPSRPRRPRWRRLR